MNKPLRFEDFNLTPDELKTLVEGSQKYLPPEPEEGEKEAVDVDAESTKS